MKLRLSTTAMLIALFSFNTPVSAKDHLVASAHDWTGLYIGANIASAWNDSRWNASGATPFDADGKGWLGGGQLGYRHQTGNFVFGVEGSADAAFLEGKSPCIGPMGAVCYTKQDYLGSVTASAGFTADQFYFYGTGGVAFTGYHDSQPIVPQKWKDDGRVGWTAGIGAEYALGKDWTAGIQWNYYDFGAKSADGGRSPRVIRFTETENVIAARLNFRF